MTSVPKRANESACLEALHALEILDSEPEAEFDAIVNAAAALCRAPISLISLIDSDRQWFKAGVGFGDVKENSRELSFCAHAVLGEELFEVPDATLDPRFADNASVTGLDNIRFYAGAPVRLRDGTCVGTLCVVDTKPRTLNGVQRDALRDLSRTVAHALEGRHAIQQALKLAAELSEKNALLHLTLLSVADGVLTTNIQGDVTFLNPVAERLTGWSMVDAQGQSLKDIFRRSVVTRDSLETGAAGDVLFSRLGQEHVVETSSAPIKTTDGTQVGEIWTFRDVTEQRRTWEQIKHQAMHDALTGLVNRTVFDARLEMAVQTAREAHRNHALMYVDLDQFKLVNDACGHAAGDKLLKQIAQILSEAVRPSDVVARLGGDEFAVLIEDCTEEHAQQVAQRFCDRMDDLRFVHNDQKLRVGASVGLVPLNHSWRTAAAVLQAADASCYAAKEAGRNRVHAWFDTDLAVRSRQEDVKWASLIERALDEDRFTLYAQRISDVKLAGGGIHAEVLVRMISEDNLLVAPGTFLPAAERFNLISRIDRWVLRRTISALREGPPCENVKTLSVNLSGHSVGDPAFHAWAYALFKKAGSEICAKLCIEITETSAIANLAQASEFIAEVRAMGLRVALDDFGAGASSFGYLKQLTLDCLKIDGQFVRGLLTDALDEAAVQCFVNVAKVLQIKTVAEYVDNFEVLARLEGLGVDFVQGFLIHRPEPLASVLQDAGNLVRRVSASQPKLTASKMTTKMTICHADGQVVRAVQASEHRYRQILDAIPDMVLLKAEDSRLLWANAAFRNSYGIAKEYFDLPTEKPVFNPEVTQQYIKDDASVFSDKQTLVIPNEPMTRLDGEVLRVHTTKSPIYDEHGNVQMLVAVCHDLTERNRLEAQLRLADRMASVGTLAAGIAHEINTPVQFVSDSIHFLKDATEELFGLISFVDRLKPLVNSEASNTQIGALFDALRADCEAADLPYLVEHVPKAIERCVQGLERVSTIVSSMKAFAHPSQDEMAPADLNKAVHNTLMIAQSEYRFIAAVETDFGALPPVTCFVSDINQVILNILINAAHAIADVVADSSSKGVIKVVTRQEGQDAVIAISDTGPGIAPGIAQRVFEMFFTTKEVGKGTGQGLALAWSVVAEKHGGQLTFETTLGVGTTFFIRLPIAGRHVVEN